MTQRIVLTDRAVKARKPGPDACQIPFRCNQQRLALVGALIHDITRKIDGNEALQKLFAASLSKAMQIRWQNHNQRDPKLYSWHAPETECIGKGTAHKPYESERKCPSPPPTGAARTARLSCTPRRYPEIRSTVIPWPA